LDQNYSINYHFSIYFFVTYIQVAIVVLQNLVTIARSAQSLRAIFNLPVNYKAIFRSSVMGVHYLKLALLTVAATTALSQSARQLGDFDWGFQPEDGFPAIAFNDTTQKSGVAFKYSYTGTLTAQRS
jgi:hypothetical protein